MIYEIPLISESQFFRIPLNGKVFVFTVIWRDAPYMNGGWVLDIADDNGNNLLQGMPLVTGEDLLAQFEYVDIGGQLFVQTDYSTDDVPLYTNLGSTAHLYYVPP